MRLFSVQNDKALYSEIRSMLEQDSSNTSVSVRQLVETPWDPTSSGFSYGKVRSYTLPLLYCLAKLSLTLR